MNGIQLILPNGDRRLFLAWLGLALFSLAVLWSVTEPIKGPYEAADPVVAKEIFHRQVIWMILSYAALVVASRLSLNYLDNIAIPLYLLMVLLLVFLLVAGPRIAGARRWLVVGPLQVQPSEFAKVAFILMSANLLGRSWSQGRSVLLTLASGVAMAVPMILVLKEPDLGTSLVFLAIWVGMVFWYGIPDALLLGAGSTLVCAVVSVYAEIFSHSPWAWWIYFPVLLAILYVVRFNIPAKVIILALNILSALGILFIWNRLQEYQQDRIMAFFDPAKDAFGSGYQVIQSRVAIGSGGFFGKTYLAGTQKGLAFLPERHTDFIFSVVGEELGLIGACALLALFLVIILKGMHYAAISRRPFPGFVAIGVTTYFVFHVVVNVAITTGLLPVTGLPLPFISYGGSNLLVSGFMLGLLMNVSARTFSD